LYPEQFGNILGFMFRNTLSHDVAGQALPTAGTTTAMPQPPAARGLSGVALGVLLMGFALSVTDFFIVNVALPTIGRDLHASDSMLELVVAAYGITYAVLLVLGGRLGDAIGRRRLFMGGMAAFTVMSLACGLAPTIGLLLAFRALQGAAAALVVPQVLATIQASTDGEERARAVGMFAATAGLSMVAGQILGGTITWLNAFGTGWRGIFVVNVPVGIVGLLIARRSMPDTRSNLPSRIDARGTVLLAGTLLALLIPLTEGKALGWPVWSWVLLILVPAGGFVFARYERSLEFKGGLPLVPPSLVQHKSMRRGLGVVIPFFASFGGFMFLYAVVTQNYLGLSPLTAGATLAPYAAAFCIASILTPRAVGRFGSTVITAGAVLQAIGFAGLFASVAVMWPHVSVLAITPGLIVAGFGQGLVVGPLLRTILSDIPPQRAGAGAGVFSTGQQTALALGVALVGELYSALISPFGIKGAVLVIVAIDVVVAGYVALASRGLPSLRMEASREVAARAEGDLEAAHDRREDAEGDYGDWMDELEIPLAAG
jgi:MFS family permease